VSLKELQAPGAPSRTVCELLGSSSSFLLLGLFLGNPVLLCMGLVPLFFLILGLSVPQPSDVRARREGGKASAVVGEELEREVEVEVGGGVGPVVFADRVPEVFELTGGSNFSVIWKGFRPARGRLSYRVRCTRRGVYELPLGWEARHPLRLRQTVTGVCAGATLEVRPRILDVRRVRSAEAASRIPFPSGAVARVGPVTLEFRELREYLPGDPFRFINWKATARAFRGIHSPPVVSEYEREGARVVWILLDRSPAMRVGPSTASAFEHAAAASYSLAHYYLTRGCRVGLCLYDGRPRVVFPDAGMRQYRRILLEILRAEAERERFESPEFLEEVRREMEGAEAVERYLHEAGLDPYLGFIPEWRRMARAIWRERGGEFRAVAELLRRERGELEGEALSLRGELELRFPSLSRVAREFGVAGGEAGNLAEAVRACRGHSRGCRPFFVVVTRFQPEAAQGLAEGLREVARLCPPSPRLPVLVINVSGVGAPVSDESRAVLSAECVVASRRFRGRVWWVDWDPRRVSLTAALLTQAVRRWA
jgi:uncharacterized protein (DUF58 family)